MIEDSEIRTQLPVIIHNMSAEKLVTGFDPHTDTVDRRILYELTGRKVDPTDYCDDSSASSGNNESPRNDAIDSAAFDNNRMRSRTIDGLLSNSQVMAPRI